MSLRCFSVLIAIVATVVVVAASGAALWLRPDPQPCNDVFRREAERACVTKEAPTRLTAGAAATAGLVTVLQALHSVEEGSHDPTRTLGEQSRVGARNKQANRW